MRAEYSLKVEQGRLLTGQFRTLPGERDGAFVIPGPCGMDLHIVASSDLDPISDGWEHVSVSGKRCPNWVEMCHVKDLFWEPEELVVQFHPPKSQYVNCHPTCLHLWARPDGSIRTPPTLLVGPRTLKELHEQKKLMGL